MNYTLKGEETATPAERAMLYKLVEKVGGFGVDLVNTETGVARLAFSVGRGRTVAIGDLAPPADETSSFVWTEAMYQAFDLLPGKPRPSIDVLISLNNALNGARIDPRSEMDVCPVCDGCGYDDPAIAIHRCLRCGGAGMVKVNDDA